jgi:tetratricopeptide (TPR) repeat protein
MLKHLYCVLIALGLISQSVDADQITGEDRRGSDQTVTADVGEWERHSDAGKTAYRQRRYSDAEKEFLMALQKAEKLGSYDPRLARTLNDLAAVYSTQEKYAEAEPLYRRALEILERGEGAEQPDTATSLNNLAVLYDTQGRYSEAEALYRRALAIDEKTLGSEHADIATDLNNLAGLYDTQGKYDKAEPLYLRALAIDEKVFGRNHPIVGVDLENYAGLLRKMGRDVEAEQLESRAQTIRATYPEMEPK